MAGTKTITTLREDIARHPWLESENINYGDRMAFKLKIKAVVPLSIDVIVLVRLNDGVSENIKVSEVSALHKLYPFFMDAVNADTIICGKVLVGISSLETQQFLVDNLVKVLKDIPVYSISGSMDFIIKSLENI